MSDGPDDECYHTDSRRFREALKLAATVSGFSEHMIEKDYYCSLALRDLSGLFAQGLVFKGGTCLSKVHAEFFRLSEDLDFAVSLRADASRSERRRTIAPIRKHFESGPPRPPGFQWGGEIQGRNESRQHDGRLEYRSVVTGELGLVKLEISLREPVIMPSEPRMAKTLLIDPYTGRPAIPPFNVRAICRDEAYAEKVRAALTRRRPAIRDCFDLDHAIRFALLDHRGASLLELVRAKLDVDGTAPVDLSPAKCRILQGQVETELRPVLRTRDYESFDLSRAIAALEELVRLLSGGGP